MSHKLNPRTIAADRKALKALGEMPDYQPVNPTHSVAHLQQLDATLTAAQENKERLRRAYEQACVVEADTAVMFHDAVMGAKSQVVAQYGSDSFAVQAIGLTRRSNRKRPDRKAGTAA